MANSPPPKERNAMRYDDNDDNDDDDDNDHDHGVNWVPSLVVAVGGGASANNATGCPSHCNHVSFTLSPK